MRFRLRHSVPRSVTASSVMVANFYNPLMHWLLQRVIVYQDLVADELTAAAI
ncbi:MAG TPA: hypothetical protein P5307_07925 [Pirellulaceae bacterium]|nr:hypothetical protein [Pirellulaceae bacterium]